jgi:hypothetical protein
VNNRGGGYSANIAFGNISLAPDLHRKVQVASFAFGETSLHQSKVIIGVFSDVGFAFGETN